MYRPHISVCFCIPYYRFITPEVLWDNFKDKLAFTSYHKYFMIRGAVNWNVCMSAYITQKGNASTKLQYAPLSFSVKHTFPPSVLSFPWLHVSAVSLLSKKGLRYLLYPFISLWMVGGRISPSFTSALSIELSNNLRTETDKGRKKRGVEEKTQKQGLFFVSAPVVHLPGGSLLREHLAIHTICRVSIELHGKY